MKTFLRSSQQKQKDKNTHFSFNYKLDLTCESLKEYILWIS